MQSSHTPLVKSALLLLLTAFVAIMSPRPAAGQNFGLAAPVPFGNGMNTGTANFDSALVTVETWIRVNEFNMDHGEPVQYLGNNGVAWQFILEDAGGLQMTAAFQVGGTSATSGPILTRGVWHHIAGTYDSQLVRLFVDGNLVAVTTRTAGIPGAGANSRVKCSVKMRCDMDDIRIWNVPRRADQIQCSKNQPFGTILPAGLVAYWTMDNGYSVIGTNFFWEFPSRITSDRAHILQVSITTPIPSGATFSAPPTMTVTADAPTVQTTTVGSTAYFDASAVGIVPANYTWQVLDAADPSGWTFVYPGVYNIPGLPPFSIASGGPDNRGIFVTPLGSSPAVLRFRPTAGAECFYAFSTNVATLNISCDTQVSAPTPVTVSPGGTAVFTVNATGSGPFTYSWRALDLTVPCCDTWNPMQDVPGRISGVNTSTLTLSSISCSDRGSFLCVVSSPCGSVGSAGASLTVSPALVIASQPLSGQSCLGGSSLFSVVPTGTGPFTYQWQIQTSPLPNENWLTLTTAPVPLPCGATSYATATPSDSSTASIFVRSTCPAPPGTPPGAPTRWPIRCVVSNSCGSVTSNNATLTVCPADFNCSGAVDLGDVFAFLNSWFANSLNADFDGLNGVTLQDIFDFLNSWFAGC